MLNAAEVAVRPVRTGLVQFVPTVERILYGAGVVQAHLTSEVARLSAERVLLLTPRSLARSLLADGVRAALGPRLAGSFAAAFEHVPLERVAEAVAVAGRLQADLVVALGGGSVIDAAKALRTCLAGGIGSVQSLGAFMERPVTPAETFIPLVSIPTTLSGSEYTRSFSATDFVRGVKRSYTHSAVASRVILYDPAATLATPEPLWLASGVMALTHAVEVFCASPAHLVGDMLKLTAARELLGALPRTRQDRTDLDARLRCQVAAWLADHSPLRAQPLVPQASALPVHQLAYELGALCHVGYGLAACVTLPASLRWTAAHVPQTARRQAELARELGIAPAGAADEEATATLAAHLRAFIALLGLPTRLRDVGVSGEDVRRVARSFAARGAQLTPMGPASEDDVVRLLIGPAATTP